MTKNISIQIQNADKKFGNAHFKLRGHDIFEFVEKYKKVLTMDEWSRLSKALDKLKRKWGDYEIYIKVYPSRIEVVDFLEDEDDTFGGVF